MGTGFAALLSSALIILAALAPSSDELPLAGASFEVQPRESSSPSPSSTRVDDESLPDDTVVDQPSEPDAPSASAPPPPPPAPAPPPAPPAASTDEQQVSLALVNEQRAAAGVAPIVINAALTRAAVTQAQHQAATLTMTHDGNGGLAARVSAAGYTYCWIGENVAAGYPDATAVHTAWVNSPGHLSNIVRPTATDMGLASAVGSNGRIYWAQVFGGRC
jgi:uncharacterized protein YkwD